MISLLNNIYEQDRLMSTTMSFNNKNKTTTKKQTNNNNKPTIATAIIMTSMIALILGPTTNGLIFALASAQQQDPTQGYGDPTGLLTAVRHVFDDPSLRVFHYCKPNDKIMMVCQLYDSNSSNATLIGIEYMINADTYNSLPDREKPNWHFHKEEFAADRADPKFPQLNPQQQQETLKKLENSYGKIILTWNPNDNTPAFPPQIQQVQHPYIVNSTVKPETNSGGFNQTLKY
jgi:hypothetical protein